MKESIRWKNYLEGKIYVRESKTKIEFLGRKQSTIVSTLSSKSTIKIAL